MATETTTLTLTARDVRRMQPQMAELLQTLRKAAAIADSIGMDKIDALHDRGNWGFDEIKEMTRDGTIAEIVRSMAAMMAVNGMTVPADDADGGESSDDAGIIALQRIGAAAEVIRAEVDANGDAIKAACKVAKQDESAIDNLLTGDGYGEVVDLQSAAANIINRHRLMAASKKARVAKVTANNVSAA